MSNREHSQAIRKRFIHALLQIAKENYPDVKEYDIAEKVGISRTNYHRLKNSENNYPTLDNCVELCLHYKISPSWLLTGSGTMKTNIENKRKSIDILKAVVAEIEMELKQKNKK